MFIFVFGVVAAAFFVIHPSGRAILFPPLRDCRSGRGLTRILLMVFGICLADVGDVVDPALLGARTDVEVHALDRFERAVFGEQFLGDLGTDERHAGDVVGRVADERLKIDNLVRPDAPGRL